MAGNEAGLEDANQPIMEPATSLSLWRNPSDTIFSLVLCEKCVT